MKLEIAMGLFFACILGFIVYLMVDFQGYVEEKVNWCEEVGGIPVKGDKGRFKICLDPSAVIKGE